MSFPFILSAEYVSVCLPNSAPTIINKNNPMFPKLVKALQNKDFEVVKNLLDPQNLKLYLEEVQEYISDDMNICYNGKPVSKALQTLIKNHYMYGLPSDNLMLFFEKLQLNPSYKVVSQLFDFIEASLQSGGFTITENGNLVAYKKVREDYKDIYSGTLDNSIGNIVEMARNEVNDNSEETCSNGLHFAAFSYLSHYGSSNRDTDRIIILEINPADIVSIPVDYSFAKGRCCKYKVVGEYKDTYKEKNTDVYKQHKCVINTEKNTECTAQTVQNDEPEFVITTGDSFLNLVENVLKKYNKPGNPATKIVKTDEVDKIDYAQYNSFTFSDFYQFTGNELYDLYVRLVKNIKTKHTFTIPLKFKDKKSAIYRIIDVLRYIRKK